VALSVIPFLGGIPGYYPAPCSMKFGLSSLQEIYRRAIAQPEPIFYDYFFRVSAK